MPAVTNHKVYLHMSKVRCLFTLWDCIFDREHNSADLSIAEPALVRSSSSLGLLFCVLSKDHEKPKFEIVLTLFE